MTAREIKTPRIKSNVHTHTLFCDGENSMEEMIERAQELGFDTLGFSFHSFTPFDPSYCIRDYYAYMQEFERLKKQYAGDIALLNGVELDLFGQKPSVCDYVIGSVHYLCKDGRYYPVDLSSGAFAAMVSKVYSGDALAAAESYYKEYASLAREVKPDIYGHLDLITRFNAGGSFFDEHSQRYMRAVCGAIEALPQGAVVEVNAGRMFKEGGALYPAAHLLPLLKERGCRFMLSSDAHSVQALGFAFDEICSSLKSAGIKSVVRYKGDSLAEEEL